MLLSRSAEKLINKAGTSLGLLWENYQFEYLTARITFLQGLLNWLAAIALEHSIPRDADSAATARVNKFIASSLATLILFMLSFYNDHLTFYTNYFGMLWTYSKVIWFRFIWHWPPRILPIVALPSMLASLRYGWQALADSFAARNAKEN